MSYELESEFLLTTLHSRLYSFFRRVSRNPRNIIRPIPTINAINTSTIRSFIAPVRKATNAMIVLRNVKINAISAKTLPHFPAAFNQIGIIILLKPEHGHPARMNAKAFKCSIILISKRAGCPCSNSNGFSNRRPVIHANIPSALHCPRAETRSTLLKNATQALHCRNPPICPLQFLA